MSIESTRVTIERFLKAEHNDSSMLADDVIFTMMASGDENRGPEAVLGMFQYLYHVAFDAHAKLRFMVYGEQSAALEYDFIGKHIGEFMGIPATNKDVSVPFCVVYELEHDKIKRANIYFESPALLKQLGIAMG